MNEILLITSVPAAEQNMDLVVNGIIIGRVSVNANRGHRYHVAVPSIDEKEGLAILYQGHGNRLEDAIAEMLDKHEMQAIAQLHRIKELRTLLQN